MTRPPAVVRAIAFIDGQNLFAAARDAFGVRAPSFDVVALSHAVAEARGWEVHGVRFYSGVPAAKDNEHLHRAWTSQLREMRTQGVHVTVRPLRRRRKRVRLDDGTTAEFTVLEEKGIDVRIALDIVRAVIDGACDAVLLFSQDQDFVEVAVEVRCRTPSNSPPRAPNNSPAGTRLPGDSSSSPSPALHPLNVSLGSSGIRSRYPRTAV